MGLFLASDEKGVNLTGKNNSRYEYSRSVEAILQFGVGISPYDDCILCSYYFSGPCYIRVIFRICMHICPPKQH